MLLRLLGIPRLCPMKCCCCSSGSRGLLVSQVSISGCAPQAGGVGIDLTHMNMILDIRPGTAAARALESGSPGLMVGDRVLSVDGIPLHGRILTEVIQPADDHTFEVREIAQHAARTPSLAAFPHFLRGF